MIGAEAYSLKMTDLNADTEVTFGSEYMASPVKAQAYFTGIAH